MMDPVNDAAAKLAFALQVFPGDDHQTLDRAHAIQIATAVRKLVDAQIKAAIPDILRRMGVV